ncbi:hypothetical protein, variant [Aphanomyces invadans]|uniref:Uncharacterized protein n=1 Tax=Aphanomyces invadans TaxID=157072 RepID=A0A024TXI0_9STRA|nr:hypothetical protein, variant [Aphanomyces invadans]XP_008872283.1 hypothetical protein H310_08355 [Aphanomyces invadans]ETV98854.1 hypothetical protein H310_08355 [Aphanomyces invadans]ETV98855.1 hypothetical protein, variant [Aphanomyces invadans]|eukprot:XP_008872282.1 hypothetical protein, variant [Aphanomyces invadans]
MTDFRGMHFREEDEPAAHRAFVRQLREGCARITMMQHGQAGYELMHVRLDVAATSLTWSPSASHTSASQAKPASMLLETVLSVVPWTHKTPSKRPSKAELVMGNHGVFYGISVAYNDRDTPSQLMLLCHNETEQHRFVASLRSLVHTARVGAGLESEASSPPPQDSKPTRLRPKKPSRTISAASGLKARRRVGELGHTMSALPGSSYNGIKAKYRTSSK